MPSKHQEFLYPEMNTEDILLYAYGASDELGWKPLYAGPNALAMYTPRSWKRYDDEVIIQATDGKMTVTSNLVHGESFDLLGKNQKHINDFITVFEKIRSAGVNPEWITALEVMRQKTIEAATVQVKQAEEVDKIMKFSSGSKNITYGIIGVNIAVFALMVLKGVSFFQPTGYDILLWGANYGPLTVTGDWWRLITCVFVHIGIVHLAFNMYALYMAGVYLEPMLGKTKYLVAYLCTGIFASITSLAWHSEPVPSAGASGAIFGMYGVFLALLLTNLIPKQIRIALLQSIGVFVVFNLVYGIKSGIDNAAHIGGLASGMIIGFIYYLSLKKESEGNRKNSVVLIVAAVTVAITWFYLDTAAKNVSPSARQKIKSEISEGAAKDGQKFLDAIDQLSEIDKNYASVLNNNSLSKEELVKQLDKMKGEWDRAGNIIEEMKKLDVSDLSRKKINILEQYAGIRKEEVLVRRRLAEAITPADRIRLSELKEAIEKLGNQLQELK